jgi:hypothetical protein
MLVAAPSALHNSPSSTIGRLSDAPHFQRGAAPVLAAFGVERSQLIDSPRATASRGAHRCADSRSARLCAAPKRIARRMGRRDRPNAAHAFGGAQVRHNAQRGREPGSHPQFRRRSRLDRQFFGGPRLAARRGVGRRRAQLRRHPPMELRPDLRQDRGALRRPARRALAVRPMRRRPARRRSSSGLGASTRRRRR